MPFVGLILPAIAMASLSLHIQKNNSTFNLKETIPEPKIVRNVLRSLPERFHAKIATIEELKDIDKIPLTELIGNLQTYELGLTRIAKSSKSKSML